MKNVTEKQIKNALKIISHTRLPNADHDDIECEVGRLERCIERFYKEEHHDMHFLEFSSYFIQQNFHELTFGTLFNSDFIEDVLDEVPPDITNYFKYKAIREKGGALNQYAQSYSTEYCNFDIASIQSSRYNKMEGYNYE